MGWGKQFVPGRGPCSSGLLSKRLARWGREALTPIVSPAGVDPIEAARGDGLAGGSPYSARPSCVANSAWS